MAYIGLRSSLLLSLQVGWRCSKIFFLKLYKYSLLSLCKKFRRYQQICKKNVLGNNENNSYFGIKILKFYRKENSFEGTIVLIDHIKILDFKYEY